jgi:hypothetical protein
MWTRFELRWSYEGRIMTYYKFLRLKDDQVISDWDGSAWKKSEWRDIADSPILQAQGFYASDSITDAVQWFGNVLAEVEVRGRSVPGRVMSVHQGMRITRAWKFSCQDWLDLAIYTAELVLPVFESRFPDDKRPRTAVESGSAADAADAAGSAASTGARSAAHAARAAVAAADAITRRADAAAYAAHAIRSADGATHGISAAARTDAHNKIEGWLRERISGMESLW